MANIKDFSATAASNTPAGSAGAWTIDDEIRQLKADIKTSFPNFGATADTGVVTMRAEEIVISSQAEAEAGTINNKLVSPLRVKQAIDEFAPQQAGQIGLSATPSVTVDPGTWTVSQAASLFRVQYTAPSWATGVIATANLLDNASTGPVNVWFTSQSLTDIYFYTVDSSGIPTAGATTDYVNLLLTFY